MAKAQDTLKIGNQQAPIVSKGMGTQEELGGSASKEYQAGKYFVGNDGYYYLVTQLIQQNGTITVGTNCTKTDLSAELEGKAPKNHASAQNTYGVGDVNNYGHVKVDDALSDSSTNTVQNKVVKEKTDSIEQALSNEAEARAELGAHNVLNFRPTEDLSLNEGLTYVYNNSHQYTATAGYGRCVYEYPYVLKAGESYIITFKMKATLNGDPMMIRYNAVNDSSWEMIRNPSTSDSDYVDVSFQFTASATKLKLNFYVQYGSGTGNVLNIKDIMIRLATDAATTYHPYAKTNKQLTDITDNLTATVEDNAPYVLRQGKGSLVDFDMVGGTVAWNQIIANGNFESNTNWVANYSTFSINDNVGSFVATQQFGSITKNQNYWTQNHKYLFVCDYKCASEFTGFYIYLSNAIYLGAALVAKTNWQRLNSIFEFTTTSSTRAIIFQDNRSSGWSEISIKNVQAFDLTQMFGTTIADYIYSLEQATAGAGVAWFRQYFPKSYYAYDAGNLLSVKPSGRKVVGKNLLNPSTFKLVDVTGAGVMRYGFGPIRLLAGTYTFSRKASSPSTSWYVTNVTNGYSVTDASANPFTFTLNADAEIMIRTGTSSGTAVNDTDIQLEFGSTATNYTPYDSTTYDFPSIDLRGLFKLDANNKLYADGDVYNADGNITSKFTIRVFSGSGVVWNYAYDKNTVAWFSTQLALAKGSSKCISDKLINVDAIGEYEGIYINSSGNIHIGIEKSKLSSVDAAGFLAWLGSNNVTVVYELATPTAESAPTFINPQNSSLEGTEEWIDERDVAIPVGHNSIYYLNETYVPLNGQIGDVYEELRTEEVARAELGAHNLWDSNDNIKIQSNLAVTKNSDGSFTIAAGTLTQTFLLPSSDNVWKAGLRNLKPNTTYIFSNGTNKLNLQAFYIAVGGSSYIKIAEAQLSESLEFTTPASYDMLYVRMGIDSGATFSEPLTVYPMIRLKTDYDSTYRPYAPTNSQLLSHKDNGIVGAKNLLGVRNYFSGVNEYAFPYTTNGVTFNANTVTGAVSISATSLTNSAYCYFLIRLNQNARLTASVLGLVSSDDFVIYDFTSNTNVTSFVRDEEVTFDYDSSHKIALGIRVRGTAGSAIAQHNAYPMVRLASDSDSTYQLNAYTNQELTKSVLFFTSVACSATTGNFASISNSDITVDHVVVDCVFANPSAITTDVTWTTSNGSLVLNGTCTSATTATITLARKGN